MPAPLEIIVTNAGRAAIVNAQNTGTAPVTITQIGLSGTAVTPLPTSAALTGEFKRVAAIAGEVVADDTIHVTLTDTSGDAYSLRSIGLYLADGTLFAIYGQAAPVLEKTAQSIAALSIDVIFADIAAAAITFGNATFTNPPATTERQGVVELATVAEAQAGIDALRALTASAAKAAILGWLLSQDGSGSGLDADLLDGQHGSYYANIPDRLGFMPARNGHLGNVDLNTAITSGMFRFDVPTNGPAGVSYGQLLVIHGAGDTITQILGEFGTGGLWTRSGDPIEVGGTGSWRAWKALVSASGPSSYSAADVIAKLLTVDGSGSGLDADLLDGQDASFFTNIIERLGFTPANKAGDTMTGPLVLPGNPATALQAAPKQYVDGLVTAAALLAKLLTVDGSGSGLDADLLDGFNSSYFTDIVSRLGYTPARGLGALGNVDLNTATTSGMYRVETPTNGPGGLSFGQLLVVRGAGDTITQIYSSYGDGVLWTRSGNPPETGGAGAWSAWSSLVKASSPSTYSAADVLAKLLTVDGSGSGVDADLLDGFHASDLLRVIAESKAASGYMQLSNGLLLQWGRWTSSATPGAALNINFPVAFSAEPYTLVTMPVVTTSSGATTWSSDGITGTAFPARCSIASIGCRYFAIGPV